MIFIQRPESDRCKTSILFYAGWVGNWLIKVLGTCIVKIWNGPWQHTFTVYTGWMGNWLNSKIWNRLWQHTRTFHLSSFFSLKDLVVRPFETLSDINWIFSLIKSSPFLIRLFSANCFSTCFKACCWQDWLKEKI